MNMKNFIVRFIVTFAIAFTVNAVVIYIWNLFDKGGTFKWEQSFVIAIFIGVILSLTRGLGDQS
ncbi:MAG: hypothetical protein A2Y92_01020 [Chloroflexi bacterium RBG_13_57_8]|nr:MAG: hypothetical protein A2Y92_01020 [Chloroflexi bacterium RBG_13_57_8]